VKYDEKSGEKKEKRMWLWEKSEGENEKK